MKVAVIFDNFGPYHLARLRAASGICTLLAIQADYTSRDYDWEPSATTKEFSSATLTNSDAFPLLREVWRNRRIRRTLAEFAPDCVFLPGWSRSYSLKALQWCRANGVPVVIMSETTRHDSARCGWKEWLKTTILKRCSAALAGGAPHAEYLIELGMSKNRIFLGYDAVDNHYFGTGAQAVREQEAELRRKYGLPLHYFLSSARFIEKKNLCRLLGAYAKYRRAASLAHSKNKMPAQSRPWSLVILGDGPQKAVIQRTISTLGLEPFVLLPGFKQYADLPAFYGLATAFIHASTSEPWGLVVNEAMASGLPVLVSNRCGCAPDLVREGLNGFTFDPLNIDQLAKLMLVLGTFQSQLAIFGGAGAKIISNWGPGRFAQGFRSAAETAVCSGLLRSTKHALYP